MTKKTDIEKSARKKRDSNRPKIDISMEKINKAGVITVRQIKNIGKAKSGLLTLTDDYKRIEVCTAFNQGIDTLVSMLEKQKISDSEMAVSPNDEITENTDTFSIF